MEEKLEFLKRGEIRTMEKDIARLREIEAQKERERVAALNLEEKPSLPPAIEVEIQKEKKEPIPLIPEPPKRPSSFKKILIRAIIAAVLFFILGFIYWFFEIRLAETQLPPEEIIPRDEEIIQPIQSIIPLSLVEVNTTETIAMENLTQLLKKVFDTDGFTRVLIKKGDEIMGLKEFLEAFAVKTPTEFLDKIENDFTLFINSSQGVNRLGFVTKVKAEENLSDALASWELTIEKDTENLFTALGKEGASYAPYFRSSFYKETEFRFLTISLADFGICYTLFDGYFIFTTSFEGMQKAIEASGAKKKEENIGQILMIGFRGSKLTPETEQTFKKYRPGGVILLSQNIESEEQLKKLTQDLQALSLRETGLPLLIAVDQEGGAVSRIVFSQENIPQPEIETPEQAFQVGLNRGKELKELGININLAPVLDITKEGDFLHSRSFQKNARETGELAKSLILGQKTAGIFTSLKHFPGYNGITSDPEESLIQLAKLPEISQFKKTMEAEPEFVMTSNVIYTNIDSALPFTFSPQGIQLLKNDLGSEVLIMSDDLARSYLLEKFSLRDLFAKPVQAGVDLLIFSGWQIDVPQGLEEFYAAFRKEEVSQTKINQAVERIIKLKNKLTQ